MATTMHKEDCPNLDPEQIMAIDCTYVYWTRSKERLFFFPSILQDAAAERCRCQLEQENGGLLATNNLAVPKELYALRKQKNDDITLLGKIGDYSTTFEENWRTKNCYDSNFFLAAPGNRHFQYLRNAFISFATTHIFENYSKYSF